MKDLQFIDLFAGLGGFRIALESVGGTCVFSSEIHPHACSIYQENFKDNPFCDITQLQEHTIADFDVLCAGFPCQAWSVAGKGLGDKDERGMLFWTTLDIIKKVLDNNPKAKFLLENVKMKKEF